VRGLRHGAGAAAAARDAPGSMTGGRRVTRVLRRSSLRVFFSVVNHRPENICGGKSANILADNWVYGILGMPPYFASRYVK
jgi:hypothetical protein